MSGLLGKKMDYLDLVTRSFANAMDQPWISSIMSIIFLQVESCHNSTCVEAVLSYLTIFINLSSVENIFRVAQFRERRVNLSVSHTIRNWI